MKSILISILILGFDLTTFATNGPVEMPDSIKGVQIGIPLSDFLKMRPNANPFELNVDNPPQRVDATSGNQILIEKFGVADLYSNAMYQFKDDKLIHATLVLDKNIEDFRKVRASLISSFIQKWGTQFQKRVVRIPSRKNENFTPMLSWDKGNIKIIVLCSPDDENDVKAKHGVLQVNIFGRDATAQNLIPKEEKVDDKTSKKLFESIGALSHDK